MTGVWTVQALGIRRLAVFLDNISNSHFRGGGVRRSLRDDVEFILELFI